MFYTYAHYTPQGRLFYIGKGQGNRAHRLSSRGSYWKNVVVKYGKPNVQILANWDTEQEALDHEILLIDCFKELGHKLCNITNGGEGVSGLKQSEHQKSVASQVHKSNKWRQGIKHSEERKKQISEFFKNHKYMVGTTQTVEHRQKNSIAQLGNSRALGSKHSEKTKIQISKKLRNRKKPLVKFCWVGTHIATKEVISFASANALNAAGFQHSNVIKCINGQRKSHKNYTWLKENIKE